MFKLDDILAKKHFILSAVLLSLIIMVSFNGVYAIDENQTVDSQEELQINMINNLEDIETTSQSNDILNPDGNKFSDIQNTINNAKDGDKVVLDKSIYENDGSEIYINKSVSVVAKDGTNVVLDGRGLSNIFVIQENGNNLKIKGIEFKNGFASLGGGAIFIKGHDVTIENCKFVNNEAKGGGAIYTNYNIPEIEDYGYNLKILNCIFKNNLAHIAAGAVGIYGNNSEIINCTFDSNKVYNKYRSNENVYGGALQIGMLNSNIVSKCINSKFINNSADAVVEGYFSHGGAGCIREGIDYINCKFISNKADHGGALTYHSFGKVDNCEFIGNIAKLYGGALSTIENEKKIDLIIENSKFDNNKAPIGGGAYLVGRNVNFNNCEFNSNHAYENGGAIFVLAESTNIENSIITKNLAEINGGGVYLDAKSVRINNNSFTFNEAIPDIKKINNGLGGAIFVNSSNNIIENNILNYNTARNGSAIYINKNAVKSIINNNEMFNNQAWVYHLPIYAPKNPFYGENVLIYSTITGGNNIGNYSDLSVSNGIYNNAGNENINVDGVKPIIGATDSGKLYQDEREYNIDILVTLKDENGKIIYNNTLKSNVYGNINVTFNDLNPGLYHISTKHFEDTYYKAIENSTTFRILPKVDVDIIKNSDLENYNYLDYVKWNLTVTNNGPNKASNVIVKDKLPDSLLYMEDTSEGNYDFNSGIWVVDTLDVGETKSIAIITQVLKTGLIINNAEISSKEYDYNLSNNVDNELISVNQATDLAVVKNVVNKNPNFKDEVSWTITVFNNGPDNATNVQIIDKLPEDLIYLGSNQNYNHLNGIWDIGDLNVGENRTLIIRSIVNGTGEITNTVFVSGDEFDYNLENNKDFETIDVKKAADIAITKEVDNKNPDYGAIIRWTIKVRNNGPDNATDIIVEDILPKGIVYLNSNGLFAENIWNVGNLSSGETREINIICKVNKTGNFTNFVSVIANEYDPDLTNNNANSSISVVKTVDLNVIKTVCNINPDYKSIIKWTIEVKNNGPDMATNVVINEKLPNGLVFVRDSASKGTYDSNRGIWSIDSIFANNSEFLDIYCLVNLTGFFRNSASATSDEHDSNLTNNHDFEDIMVNHTTDLGIIKSVNNTSPNYNEIIKWTIVVYNNGPDIATGVVVVDNIPKGLIIVGDDGNDTYRDGIWNVGQLNINEKKTLNIFCIVNKTGKLVNRVNITGNEVDPDLSNNDAYSLIDVNPAADLIITKTASKIENSVGELVEYEVLIKNNGPDVARNVRITDYLDSNLYFVDYLSDKGIFSENGKTWVIDSLQNGETAKLNFKALAKSAGSFKNRVLVESDTYDFNLNNNNASVIVTFKEILKNSSIKNNSCIALKTTSSNKGSDLQTKEIKNNGEVVKVNNVAKAVSKMKETGISGFVLSIVFLILLIYGFSINYKRNN